MSRAIRTLAGVLALAACASEPRPIPPAHLDPSNPDAPEASALATSTALAGAPARRDPGAGARYSCSMHPEVQSDKPGRCPKCGMALVPVEPESAPDAGAPPAEHHHHGGGR